MVKNHRYLQVTPSLFADKESQKQLKLLINTIFPKIIDDTCRNSLKK